MHVLGEGAWPPALLVESADGGPLQLAQQISPASIIGPDPGSFDFGHKIPTGGDPRGFGGGPPPLAGPPMLRRQNASRFSWPPDCEQEWTYICLSPADFVEQARNTLGEELTEEQVARFFVSRASETASYAAYVARWRPTLDAIL